MALVGVLAPSRDLLVAGLSTFAAGALETMVARVTATRHPALDACRAALILGIIPATLLRLQSHVLPAWAMLLVAPCALRRWPTRERMVPIALACTAMLAIGCMWWSALAVRRTGLSVVSSDLYVLGTVATALGLVLEALRAWAADLIIREQAASTATQEAERQQAHIAMQRASLAALLASEPVAVIATDELGHITDVNPAAEAFIGWSASEARFRLISDVIAFDTGDGRTLEEMWMQATRNGEASDEGLPAVFLSGVGRRLNVAVAVAPIRAGSRSQNGGAPGLTDAAAAPIYGAIVSMHLLPSPDDRAMQEASAERLDAFRHIVRLAVDSVPSVRGADERRATRGDAHADASSVRRPVDDETHLWLKFAANSSQEPFSVPQLLRHVADDLSAARTGSVLVTFEGREDDLPNATGDSERLHEALVELVTAISRHVGHTSTVTLSATLVEIGGPVRGFLVGSLAPGTYHRVDIHDSDGGVSRQELLRRFDPMSFTAREDAIAALHLIAAYGAIRRDGGALEFGSGAGHAPTISAYLRVAPERTSRSLPSRAAPPKPIPFRPRGEGHLR